MPVEKGDQIHVSRSDLGKTQQVQWSQSLKQRSEEYYVTRFHNNTRDGEAENAGNLYIQYDMLDKFMHKAQGGEYTLTIDEDFQYGQAKGGKMRWLVFHDKGRKPYQHRFIEGTIVRYGNAAAGFLDEQGYGQISQVGEVAQRFIGDYLRDF